MSLNQIRTWEEFEEFKKGLKSDAILVNFSESGSEKCEQVDEVLEELKDSMAAVNLICVKVEGSSIRQLSSLCQLESTPTIAILEGNQLIDKVVGVAPREIKKMVDAYVHQKQELKVKKEKLTERLQSLVRQEKVMVFMKGHPNKPLCGFSKKLVAILASKNIKYGHFDILHDEEVRQGLKEFSNWPTYPQLYVDGELLGGIDVIMEMESEGDLDEALGTQA